MKRLVASSLVIVMIFSNICYAASPMLTKEETVYVNLDSYGNVSEMNIYSKIITNGEGLIVDHSNYEKVTNLSNRSEYIQGENAIIWNVSGEKTFAYTGKIGEDYYERLPWKFDISYKLNGVEVDPSTLLGCKGLVEITLNIEANQTANEYYQNNYMMEVTGSFDMSDYLSLNSEDAMIINTGNEKTLLFVVLPGQSTTMHLEIGSEDFKMNGITMAMVPLKGEILNQVSDIADEKKDIEDALESMNLSADIILTSMGGMTTGLSGISSGVNELKNGTGELHALSGARDEDIEKLKMILNELVPIIEQTSGDLAILKSTYTDVIDFSNELQDDLKLVSKELNELNKDLSDLEEVLDRIPKNVTTIKTTISDLAKLMGNLSEMLGDTKDVSNVSTGNIEKTLLAIAEEVNDLTKEAEEILDNSSADEEMKQIAQNVIGSTEKIAMAIEKAGKAIKTLNGVVSNVSSDASSASKNLNDLKKDLNSINNMLDKDDAKLMVNTAEDLNTLLKRAESMVNTLVKYNDKFLIQSGDGMMAIENAQNMVLEMETLDYIFESMLGTAQSALKTVSGSFYTGTQKTTDSLVSVSNQLTKLTSQSNSLKSSKDTIKNILDDKSDDIEEKTNIFKVDKEAKVVSFGSEENEKVSEVEFLLKTPDIKKTKANTAVDLEKKETENITFWDRVVGIFQGILGWVKNIFA